MISLLKKHSNVFSWTYTDMLGLNNDISEVETKKNKARNSKKVKDKMLKQWKAKFLEMIRCS